MDALELRDVDDLAPPRSLRRNVGGQRRPQAEQRRNVVRGPRVGTDGRVGVREAGLVHQAAERLPDHVVRGAAQIIGMAGLAVARHVRDHEFGVGFQHRIVGQAPLGVGAGFGAFHPDVARPDQLEEQVAAFGPAEVEAGVPLVAALLYPGRRHATATVLGGQLHAQATPRSVARADALDLNHLGTLFRGQRRGERLCDQAPGRDDADTLQGPELFGQQRSGTRFHVHAPFSDTTSKPKCRAASSTARPSSACSLRMRK